MDSLQQLGTFFSSGAGTGLKDLATIGSAGAGLAGNISAERQRSQELNNLKQQQAAAEISPQQLAAQVAGAEQPLNKALVEQVGNQVSGSLAEQGLAQAPGIQATALAQALAPAQQQNQQAALQLVMQRLGIPVQYAQTLLAGNPGQTNLAPLLALFGKMGSGGGGGQLTPQQLMQLFNQNQPATPANTSWSASLPGQGSATPPSDPGLPSWLSSAPATDTNFGLPATS